MKLSVIIPVYKVEAYLDKCVESVLAQGIEQCEVILVDDCSPDKCGEKCDAWAEKDRRIRVIHRAKNGGLSAARNSGVKEARGKYITFVDSDDYIAADTYAKNIELLENNPEAKVVEYPVMVNYGSKNGYKLGFEERVMTAEQWIEAEGYTHSYAWNKIYHRELFEGGREFPENRLMEDLLTVPYLIEGKSVITSAYGLYYYCSREGTISRTVNKRLAEDYHRAVRNLYEWAENSEVNEETRDKIYLLLLNAQIVMMRCGEMPEIPERKVKSVMKWDKSLSKSMRVKAWLCSISGSRFCKYWAKASGRIK